MANTLPGLLSGTSPQSSYSFTLQQLTPSLRGRKSRHGSLLINRNWIWSERGEILGFQDHLVQEQLRCVQLCSKLHGVELLIVLITKLSRLETSDNSNLHNHVTFAYDEVRIGWRSGWCSELQIRALFEERHQSWTKKVDQGNSFVSWSSSLLTDKRYTPKSNLVMEVSLEWKKSWKRSTRYFVRFHFGSNMQSTAITTKANVNINHGESNYGSCTKRRFKRNCSSKLCWSM